MRGLKRILVGVDLALGGDRLTAGSRRAAEQALTLATRTRAALTYLHSTWADAHEENQAIRPGPSAAGLKALEELVAGAHAAGLDARLALVPDRIWIEIIHAVQRGEAELVFVARSNRSGGDAALGNVARKLMRKCPCPVWVVKPEGRVEPRVLLAATDLTVVGDRALQLAAELAEIYAAELHVAHAWPLPLAAPMLPELEVPAQARIEVELHEQGVRERFDAVLRKLPPGLRVHEHLRCGAPSTLIREVLEQSAADLLVMGSVSRSGIAGLLLGNTAERLLDRVQCSLLTIKPRDFVSPV